MIRMTTGFRKPKFKIPGGDIAGRVEAIGKNISQFQSGDEVYGDLADCGFGGFAEYVSAPGIELALKPANLTFEEAAAVPQAALVALQGLRKGAIQPGQRVLINGASGGIGTFAIQLAKYFGTEVTGVSADMCSDGGRTGPALDLGRRLLSIEPQGGRDGPDDRGTRTEPRDR